MEINEEQPALHEITEEVGIKPGSLADQLRAQRTALAETKEVILPLTGYEEYNVAVKHRLIDRKEIEVIGRKVLTETRDRSERNMRILLDTIINSTVGFYLQDGEEVREIQDDRHNDRHVLNWDEFANYLGWQTNGEGDARTAVYWVFGFNEFMVGQYGIMLNRWMANTGMKVDEEFLGEVL